jgi:hypothetical protein
MRSQRVRTLVTVLVVAVVGLAACSDDTVDPPDATTTPIETPGASPSPTATASPSPSATPSDEPDQSPSPLAGEPFDGPPLNGAPAALAVIGVAADDVLNVRAGPGVDADVVATLDPLATAVPASGAARLLPGSIWLEVTADGTTGWANSSFFAFLGGTDDITSRLLADVDERPSAPTLEELARDVAAMVASEDPPSDIVISDGPSVGDLGEVTVDVVGIGDDAVRGARLVVFATVEDDAFTLRTVESTTLCGRGVTDDGLCV